MKHALNILFIFMLTGVCIYLAASLLSWSWIPLYWTLGVRQFATFLYITLSLFLVVVYCAEEF